MPTPHKAKLEIFIEEIRKYANFFFFIALCFEQTSPLAVPMYSFG